MNLDNNNAYPSDSYQDLYIIDVFSKAGASVNAELTSKVCSTRILNVTMYGTSLIKWNLNTKLRLFPIPYYYPQWFI